MKKRIAIIDDHPLMRHGIRNIVDSSGEFEVVGEAGSRGEAIDLIEKHSPNLVIIDLILGEDDGVHFIKECRNRFETVSVLAISAGKESTFAERVLRAGAQGFISKISAPTELLTAIRTILDGDLYLSRASASRILNTVLSSSDSKQTNPVSRLSDRELHVYQLTGKGMPTREIAATMGVSRKTVDAFKEKIKVKLNIANSVVLRERATQWVREAGLG